VTSTRADDAGIDRSGRGGLNEAGGADAAVRKLSCATISFTPSSELAILLALGHWLNRLHPPKEALEGPSLMRPETTLGAGPGSMKFSSAYDARTHQAAVIGVGRHSGFDVSCHSIVPGAEPGAVMDNVISILPASA